MYGTREAKVLPRFFCYVLLNHSLYCFVYLKIFRILFEIGFRNEINKTMVSRREKKVKMVFCRKQS